MPAYNPWLSYDELGEDILLLTTQILYVRGAFPWSQSDQDRLRCHTCLSRRKCHESHGARILPAVNSFSCSLYNPIVRVDIGAHLEVVSEIGVLEGTAEQSFRSKPTSKRDSNTRMLLDWLLGLTLSR